MVEPRGTFLYINHCEFVDCNKGNRVYVVQQHRFDGGG